MTSSIWVIDDDQSIRWVLEKALQKAGYQVESFERADSALMTLRHRNLPPDVVISDVRMPGTDGLTALNEFKRRYPHLPVILMTAYSDLKSAVSSYEAGAFDYLPKPFELNEALTMIRRACQHSQSNTETVLESIPLKSADIIGEAPAMQEVFRAIGRLAKSSMTVLISGESGTGKELVATALHKHSPRCGKPYIALNMAAIPKELMESELFGHEKGAFTGASQRRQGRFEQADGGTLFLDEIGDMPAELQTRLLRVLADGEFYRVGGHSPIKVDVRIIAATHQNLERLVEADRFRNDLYHRLNVIRINVPSLRERIEDIPLLLKHFLEQAASEINVERKAISDKAVDCAMRFAWPGNVRQLENVSRWLMVMSSGQQIEIDDLPDEMQTDLDSSPEAQLWVSQLEQYLTQLDNHDNKHWQEIVGTEFEKTMIRVALKKTGGKKAEAAELIGWGRNTLTRKLKQLGPIDEYQLASKNTY